MKNIKRFEIEVETSFGSEDYQHGEFPLKITDLNTDYQSAMDDDAIAEIEIWGPDDSQASFLLNLEQIDALFEVLTHIKNKVSDSKKPQPAKEGN